MKITNKRQRKDYVVDKLENDDEEELTMAKKIAMSSKNKLGPSLSNNSDGSAINVEDELELETGSKWRIIKLKVKRHNDYKNNDIDGNDGQDDIVWFKIERDVQLRWLMIRYCGQAGLDYRATRFVFKGARLRETDTPQQLAMLDDDVIYAFSTPSEGGHGRTAAHYATLCIRMHKGKDTFLRVRRTLPILLELKRCLLSEGVVSKDLDLVCFVHNGMKLTQDHSAENLSVEDGDVIDAFDYVQSSTSLGIVRSDFSIKMVAQCGKESVCRMNPDTTPLSQLMKVYAKFASVDYQDIRLLYEGRGLEAGKTAAQYGVKDGDTFEVWLSQRGC